MTNTIEALQAAANKAKAESDAAQLPQLVSAIRDAAARYIEAEGGASVAAMYLAKMENGGAVTWAAEFSEEEDYEDEMTRWATGKDAADVFHAAAQDTESARHRVDTEARLILSDWDEDWSE